ncbi:MAG: bifunctional nicotinamidase/pyrazinamidase [Termitinemataceae bacterium]|jgi:nicotinamidase/pyrazinamidase|nr:MAG: bifunctional nicotinamidase/pyrazinamidase [Termitinemataceae bacterium]
MQNDFIVPERGTLVVPGALDIISNINTFIHSREYDVILACQDWHPVNHKSFYTEWNGKNPFDQVEMPYGIQTLWPVHTVQGSWGAEIHNGIDQTKFKFLIRKGMNPEIDSYSAFFENDKITATGLGSLIPRNAQLDCVGVATDFCLGSTALDALKFCNNVRVLAKGIAGITEESSAFMLEELKKSGVTIVT